VVGSPSIRISRASDVVRLLLALSRPVNLAQRNESCRDGTGEDGTTMPPFRASHPIGFNTAIVLPPSNVCVIQASDQDMGLRRNSNAGQSAVRQN
jgi:hypothetical protein